MHIRPRLPRRYRTLAAAAVVAAGLTTPVAAHATMHPRATPGTWLQLSSGDGIQNLTDPAVHRFGKALQVVWAQRAGSDDQLTSRILAANGSAASSVISVLTPWGAIDEYPAILSNGGQRVIVFSGIQNTDSSNPYSQGFDYYATSPDGLTWTLANGTVSSSNSAYGSYGSDAVDAAGTVVAGFTTGTETQPSFHVGLDTLPATNADGVTATNPKCCAYYTGAGYDTSNGQTWLAWYSNSGDPATDGINAQQVAPSLGSLSHAPSSTVVSNGSASSDEPGQRVIVAARSGGGLYAAYKIGYPSATRVALWRLGSGSPMVINEKRAVGFTGVAAAPGGRLWLFWWDRYTSTLRAVRTNPAATRFGRVCSVKTPHGFTDVWKTAGDGANGPLDLIVNAGSSTQQLYSTQVLPCLSASASPTAIRSSRGGTVTVTVTDAGAAVAGATVKYGTVSKKTDSHGRAAFKVATGTKKGTKRISVGRPGYTGLTVTFKVT